MKSFTTAVFFAPACVALTLLLANQSAAFSPVLKSHTVRVAVPTTHPAIGIDYRGSYASSSATILRMADGGGEGGGKGGGNVELSTKSKSGVQTIIKEVTETEMEEQKNPEEQWRVVLHNDEVHTFNYVIRSLQKVMGTLDKKKAFDICVQTHGQGQAVIVQTFKPKAMKFCVGLQRQGLTASIAPEGNFEGGGKQGGDGDGGGQTE